MTEDAVATDLTAAGWGAGPTIPGTPFRVVVPTATTDGRLVALTAAMPPGLHVDEHTHTDEDQITVVISGEVGVSVGDEQAVHTAGAVVFLPRGVPHAQWNAGAELARIVEIYTPGGFERVFEQAGARAAGGDADGNDYRAARDAASA